jgi:prepilin-type N-terminal cleavage/methylation domain-containing protein
MNRNRQKGFTLVEVIVGLAITAIIGAAIVYAMTSVAAMNGRAMRDNEASQNAQGFVSSDFPKTTESGSMSFSVGGTVFSIGGNLNTYTGTYEDRNSEFVLFETGAEINGGTHITYAAIEDNPPATEDNPPAINPPANNDNPPSSDYDPRDTNRNGVIDWWEGFNW